jgi:hypothetical protein
MTIVAPAVPPEDRHHPACGEAELPAPSATEAPIPETATCRRLENYFRPLNTRSFGTARVSEALLWDEGTTLTVIRALAVFLGLA